MVFACLLCPQAQAASVAVPLADGGRTPYAIVLPDEASAPEAYAAAELAGYLQRMSGAVFPIVRGDVPEHAIVLQTGASDGVHHLTGDAYAITVRDSRIHLTGGTPRAVLYAAYDLLARLGCRWLAPDLDLYDGTHEFIPHASTLTYDSDGDVVEHPIFSIRKLDTGGGRSHTVETLRAQLEWMAKLRFNTLMVSMTFGFGGDTTWDDWRDAIVPELEKRGMLLQVGGHGYQDFLHADLEGGALFEQHPDWFGRDETCTPRREAAYVFNTGNEKAVSYLINRVVEYVKARPEIDIFGFWPPDMAHWADCPADAALGTPQDRQARLVARLHAALESEAPDVRLEMIAYEHALVPPEVPIPADVLVDFCPLAQQFDQPIYDPASDNNRAYVEALAAWRNAFPGTIGLYSYYRKYAWRSLPNLIPHYMQNDLQWYASIPIDAVSSYAEPADWFTYELNHYALGHLAWNPSIDVERLVDDYTRLRFGANATLARNVVTSLEDVFRPHASLPYFTPDAPEAVAAARTVLQEYALAVQDAATAAPAPEVVSLERLSLMLGFALRDLEIQQARAEAAPPERVEELVGELVAFLTQYKDRGVFLVYGRNDHSRYLRHYTRDWSAVAPGAGV